MGADDSSGVESQPWRAADAQVFVDDLAAPQLAQGDDHHLRRVLRLDPDDVVCAADGSGGWRLCRLGADGLLAPDGPVRTEARHVPRLGVGFAAVKGDRPEWAVQKLTEVGIDHILVLQTERSVVRWDAERAGRQRTRLDRTAREAARQCRRLWLPELEVLPRGGLPIRGVLADAGGRALSEDDHVVLVGPEGGWTALEREGRDTVALAGTVLRSETAAVVAGAAMVSLRLGLSRPGVASWPP